MDETFDATFQFQSNLEKFTQNLELRLQKKQRQDKLSVRCGTNFGVEVTKETEARQVIGARSIQLWSLATCSLSFSARWGGLPWKITNINLQNIGYEVTFPIKKEKNDTIFLPHLFLMLKIQDVASASPSSTYRMENGPSQIIATFNLCDHWPIFFHDTQVIFVDGKEDNHLFPRFWRCREQSTRWRDSSDGDGSRTV